MKKLLPCIFLIFLSTLAFSQNDINQLVGTLLGDTPIEEDLQELCDKIGGRVTGSEANEKSVDWGWQKFRTAGVNARKEPFTMPVLWLEKSTTASILGDINFIPSVVSKYQSPPKKYRGQLISVGMGTAEEFEKAGEQVRGNFVLVEQDLCFNIDGLFAEYSSAAIAEIQARKHGAQGIIFMASRPKGLLYRFIGMKTSENDMPQIVMSREDAKRCMRILEKGKLNIELNIDAEVGGEFISNNVIAEIKGSEKPEEIIIIGAHLDSWALGTGANDNGANVAMLIDIARQMKKLNIQPKRTIRFALWNGEEQGYFGSWAYTKDNLKSMDNHVIAISIDIGSGAITGFFTNGNQELVSVVNKLLRPVAGLGDFTNINAPIVGTDNFDFMLQGVGNLVGIHKPQVYGQNYHASSDTFDKVDLKQLKVNSAIVGAVILGFANMNQNDITWKRQTRPEIQKMFESFDLEFTMRMFNVWETWLSGKRGR